MKMLLLQKKQALQCCCFLLMLLFSSPFCHCESTTNDATHQQQNFSVLANAINDCISARCGYTRTIANSEDKDDKDEGSHAIWVYEGAVFDPLDGRRVATVEGIELVRSLARVDNCHDTGQIQKFLRRCHPLQIAKYLQSEQNNVEYDSLSTILSRKLFVYKSPTDPNSLLQSIKLHPNAPTKQIPTNQAVVAYDTASSYITRNGKELIVHSEWPDGKVLWGKAILETGQTPAASKAAVTTKPVNNDDNNSRKKKFKLGPIQALDFTIYTRRRSRKGRGDPLDLTAVPPQPPDYMTLGRQKKKNTAIVSSPRRSKLVQFGQSTFDETNKFGARETYSYNIGRASSQNKQQPCTLKYTRYGEAPPFYGPGRLCTLELHGRRIDNHDLILNATENNNNNKKQQQQTTNKIPPLLQSLLSKQHIQPNFFSVHVPLSNHDDEIAQSTVASMFRRRTDKKNEDFVEEEEFLDTNKDPLLQFLNADFYHNHNNNGGNKNRQEWNRWIQTKPKVLFQRVLRASSIHTTNYN